MTYMLHLRKRCSHFNGISICFTNKYFTIVITRGKESWYILGHCIFRYLPHHVYLYSSTVLENKKSFIVFLLHLNVVECFKKLLIRQKQNKKSTEWNFYFLYFFGYLIRTFFFYLKLQRTLQVNHVHQITIKLPPSPKKMLVHPQRKHSVLASIELGWWAACICNAVLH